LRYGQDKYLCATRGGWVYSGDDYLVWEREAVRGYFGRVAEMSADRWQERLGSVMNWHDSDVRAEVAGKK